MGSAATVRALRKVLATMFETEDDQFVVFDETTNILDGNTVLDMNVLSIQQKIKRTQDSWSQEFGTRAPVTPDPENKFVSKRKWERQIVDFRAELTECVDQIVRRPRTE